MAVHSIILMLTLLPMFEADLLTSVYDVNKLLYAESDMAVILEDYINQERYRLNRLEEIARDYRIHSSDGLQQPEKSVDNLVNTFITMKRFTTDWKNIYDGYVESNSTHYLKSKMQDVSEAFPTEEDLQSTALALMRLQDTYGLSLSEMANGEVEGIEGGDQLSADDCFEVGRIAYNKEDYYHAILWIEHALQLILDGEPAIIDKETIFDYLNFAYFLEKDINKAKYYAEQWLEIDPDSRRAKNNIKHYDKLLADNEEKERCDKNEAFCLKPVEVKRVIERKRSDFQKGNSYHNYEALCRGEEPFKMPGKHSLYCSYKKPHPIYMYAPLKEEILSFEPRLVIFHGILTETEIAKAREIAQPNLQRSAVFREKPDGEARLTESRTSKTSWIHDDEDDLIKGISFKSSAASGLSLETVEQFQVVSYGIGGHYEPHYDFSRDGEIGGYDPTIGNRIATFICYLAHVEAGGATVFPEMGARIVPVKGSCALWFNLLRNGTQDFRTLHAGCPVLTGSKWIGTKWFHEKGQEFRRQCDIDPLI